MAAKTLLFSFAVLAISHQIVAEDQAPQFPSFGSLFSSLGGFQIPSFPGFGRQSSGSGFLAFPFNFPGRGSSDSGENSPSASSSSSSSDESARSKRSAEPEESGMSGFLPSFPACNYTTQPGPSCASCRDVLFCLPNNVGIRTTCRGIRRYCNNGRCSICEGSACSTTTSASTEASTEAASSTTGSTATTSA